MPVIHEFHKTENTRTPYVIKNGGSIGSIFSSISNAITNNKDLISGIGNIAGAAGSLASAGKNISDAMESVEKLKQLKELRAKNMELIEIANNKKSEIDLRKYAKLFEKKRPNL